tara:strand:+ start:241 stop:432 length:192 start_codon:yes stop_codon:yes gene_type:complete
MIEFITLAITFKDWTVWVGCVAVIGLLWDILFNSSDIGAAFGKIFKTLAFLIAAYVLFSIVTN